MLNCKNHFVTLNKPKFLEAGIKNANLATLIPITYSLPAVFPRTKWLSYFKFCVTWFAGCNMPMQNCKLQFAKRGSVSPIPNQYSKPRLIRCQAKFLTCEISDFAPCAHAQSGISHIKYAQKTDDKGSGFSVMESV